MVCYLICHLHVVTLYTLVCTLILFSETTLILAQSWLPEIALRPRKTMYAVKTLTNRNTPQSNGDTQIGKYLLNIKHHNKLCMLSMLDHHLSLKYSTKLSK